MTDLRSSSRLLSARRRRRYRLRSDTAQRDTVLRARSSQTTVSATISAFPSPTPRARDGLKDRRFLIVSAPFGAFGMALAGVLEGQGASVNRMIFNAGDALNWRRAVSYTHLRAHETTE